MIVQLHRWGAILTCLYTLQSLLCVASRILHITRKYYKYCIHAASYSVQERHGPELRCDVRTASILFALQRTPRIILANVSRKTICGKIAVVIDIRCRNICSIWKIKLAPYSWVVSTCSAFVLNETNVGENALISGRDIDETTKDACERAGVEMTLRDNRV